MPSSTPPVPERFRVARGTLWVDRAMNQIIKVGGLAVVIAVFGIFFFILLQILPLFRGARVVEIGATSVPAGDYLAMGIDEWSELPFLVRADGEIWFVDLAGDRGAFRAELPLPADTALVSFRYLQRDQRLVAGTADGRFALIDVRYAPRFGAGQERTIEGRLELSGIFPLGREGVPVRSLDYGDAGERKLAAALQEVDGRTELHVRTLTQRRTLAGRGRITADRAFDLTPLVPGTVAQVLVPMSADAVLAVTTDGTIHYLTLSAGAFELRQSFRPFEDLADPRVALADFLLGDATLVVSSVTGQARGFSLFLAHGAERRLFGRTREFAPTGDRGAEFFSPSMRNKAFLLGHGGLVELIYGTSEAVRWKEQLPYTVAQAVLGGKYDRILLLDTDNRLHVLALDDPHPEAGWRAFFGKVWYEGQPEPRFDWQSTGGSDDFEPKLSLVPLIIGSLKGTFYALLFAVPIALLAAVYTSQFLQPEWKAVVKPTMEIMASLPSVVLGFLGALWLAPILDQRVPSVLCIVVLLPVSALLLGTAWTRLPPRTRRWVRPGREFLAFAPAMVLVAWAAWEFGPVLERWVFVVRDPETGASIADFRLWWPAATGTSYEQRNALGVGFMMGFAVIPIIFTIAEDALSNVPQALRSGSLALGASRWQTAWRIVLPTASAGIFSALMIGLGRAVGETMIVVMMTGNTPILEFNIFSGMRTLSANIAVELPEAPHHGTLYRTLFLGAMVLFLLTFAVNTLAEVMRQRLRERYRTVE
jgi:phosphate transport system permease protein